jgi:hypothetical protein
MAKDAAVKKGWGLDTWAVVIALALALAVRLGLLAKVPW